MPLYGGESPKSVVTFGMSSVEPSGTQFSGRPAPSQGTAVGLSFTVRCAWPAAATAAGLVAVWSTITLLTNRGLLSVTFEFTDW